MAPEKLKEGEDYYLNEQGLMVLTADYLLRRGYCCESGCKHCPYAEGPDLISKRPESKAK